MSQTTVMPLAWRRHRDRGQFFLRTTGKPRNELAVTTRAHSPHGPARRSHVPASVQRGPQETWLQAPQCDLT